LKGRVRRRNRGGGYVAQFDQGVWSTDHDPEEQLAEGHLHFELFGTKLKGGWHLVRSRGNARQPKWLLFKDEDEYAGSLEADDLLADVAQPSAAETAGATGATKPTKHTKKAAVKKTPRKRDLPALTSPDKILYPDIGATKQDVWNYYAVVLDHLLPQIVGRPLSVIRCPSGTQKACFFQKHRAAGMELVDSVALEEAGGERADYLVVEDAAGLMELVQFNSLEFHPWGAHADTPDMADRVVFDLDPGPGVAFPDIRQAALDIRRFLAKLELESFARTSGGKGLHVVVPLNPACGWDLTRRFAHGIAEALSRSQPERFLATASKRLRSKRIYIDYLRNGRGATAVASYSLRARPGAPVAMPVGWHELARLTRPDTFTLQNVPARLRRRRKDPWEGIDIIRQGLARWAQQE
jgi:bifunctional non-homologous end joining protein LigD